MKGAAALFLLALYVSGILCQIFTDAGNVSLNPFPCLLTAIFSFQGWKMTFLVILLFLFVAGMIVFRGSMETLAGKDEERNFQYSGLGTYGTAGYMKEEERRLVL